MVGCWLFAPRTVPLPIGWGEGVFTGESAADCFFEFGVGDPVIAPGFGVFALGI